MKFIGKSLWLAALVFAELACLGNVAFFDWLLLHAGFAFIFTFAYFDTRRAQ